MTARAARPDDYEAFARLFLELESGDPVPARSWWDSTIVRKTFFVEEGGDIAGYGVVDPYGEAGHVSQVVADPAWRGRGVGRAIMVDAARRLRAAGCTRWQLNVKEGNTPAIRLYEAFGFQLAYRGHAFRISRVAVSGLPERSGLRVREVTPEDEAAIEGRFSLPGGVIAKRRAGASKPVLLMALEGEDLAAVAVGDAGFPGVGVLRATSVGAAGSLLRSFAARLNDPLSEFHTFVEDNEPLAQTLREAGATTKFVALHMRGEIPAVQVVTHDGHGSATAS